jgi:hypothetical protein
MDELLVPTARRTIPDLFEPIFTANRQLASLRVAERRFNRDRRQPPIAIHQTMALSRLDSERSKTILRPELVYDHSVHTTIRTFDYAYLIDTSDEDIAELHHYRDDVGIDNTSPMIDRLAKNYGTMFLQNYHKAIDEIQQLNGNYSKK